MGGAVVEARVGSGQAGSVAARGPVARGPVARGPVALGAVALGPAAALADQRLVGVGETLAPLLPEGGLRRGAVVGVGGRSGACSLALALVAEATRQGSWVAAVGLPQLGLVAAVQLGVDLNRLILVPDPGGQWPVVAAALLESVEILLLSPPGRVGGSDTRRLTARARERGAVVVPVSAGGRRLRPTEPWGEGPDLRLSTVAGTWEGLGSGSGHLRSRTVDVVVSGRRAAARPRTWQVLLPGPDGRVALVPAAPAVIAEPGPRRLAPLAG